MSKNQKNPGAETKAAVQSVQLTEASRVYDFGTHLVSLQNVTELSVSESGNHRLKTLDGRLHVVRPGWYAIHIDDSGKDWTI